MPLVLSVDERPNTRDDDLAPPRGHHGYPSRMNVFLFDRRRVRLRCRVSMARRQCRLTTHGSQALSNISRRNSSVSCRPDRLRTREQRRRDWRRMTQEAVIDLLDRARSDEAFRAELQAAGTPAALTEIAASFGLQLRPSPGPDVLTDADLDCFQSAATDRTCRGTTDCCQTNRTCRGTTDCCR
jgi:hypothetical protein